MRGSVLYSRFPTCVHHEPRKGKRNQPLTSTLPQAGRRYPNIQLFIVKEDNSTKLELGTKTMKVLFTSSIRIDADQPAAMNPSSTNVFAVTKGTVIFIRRTFVDRYGDLRSKDFNGLDIIEVYPFDDFAQLRQVRSNCQKPPHIFFLDSARLSRTISELAQRRLDVCRPRHWYFKGVRCKDRFKLIPGRCHIRLGQRGERLWCA
ncbi:uncharacterized protein BYT42DRAFT_617247 [Radiomyces spectabilis]|uniref:uncharacterized protein n=1 Tax=Radiomyces spectabilis TaxID=64574 RepID=UPI00221EFDC3|nr:uncharacterized protein BYT42DRAFT_617247 [Radiomyces spectabilis]KAI8370729.1 hypothetical protein BYT42DRAFT_617247 [Radiomyces spectabilis]